MKRMGTRNIFSLGLIKPGSHMWLMLNPSQLRRRAGSRVVTKIFSCQVNIYQVQMQVENQTARDFFGSVFQWKQLRAVFIVGGAHHGPPALNDSPAAVKTGMTNVASHFCYHIGTVSQAVLAAMRPVHWQHMRTRLKEHINHQCLCQCIGICIIRSGTARDNAIAMPFH